MRIIAGNLGGRLFDAPRGHKTHPMSDRVRGALFNSLGDISGKTVLDAFGGTGALSFEALSRGASQAIAIDIDDEATKTMQKNTQSLGLEKNCKIIRANASSWSNNNPSLQFDIVFAAPPYDRVQQHVVEKLVRHTKPDGLFVLDWPASLEAPQLAGAALEEARTYGNAQLAYYSVIS